MDFSALSFEALDFIKRFSPIDSGNLRRNAIKLDFISPTKIKITVDTTVAPYMPYTNEPWTSPKWNGKKNPNEHWWNDTVELLVRHIAEQYKGVVTKNDSP